VEKTTAGIAATPAHTKTAKASIITRTATGDHPTGRSVEALLFAGALRLRGCRRQLEYSARGRRGGMIGVFRSTSHTGRHESLGSLRRGPGGPPTRSRAPVASIPNAENTRARRCEARCRPCSCRWRPPAAVACIRLVRLDDLVDGHLSARCGDFFRCRAARPRRHIYASPFSHRVP
jgi:hypothetical protein